jgi:endonuclease III
MPPTCMQPVLDWYSAHARDLPWRRPGTTPWSVLVSEIMLQQTPVSRVIPAHQAWLERWPTPSALAQDAPGEAVRQWGRLGYPRRALRLHETSRIIAERHSGVIPGDHDTLRTLPGIGAYTAAAVAVFAFGRRHPVLDTNVRRVLTRLADGKQFPGPAPSQAEYRLAAGTPPGGPADRRPVVRRGDGARRPHLHGGTTPVRRVPGCRAVRLAKGRTAARDREKARAALRRDRPAVPGAVAGPPAGIPGPAHAGAPGRCLARRETAGPRARRPDSRRAGGPAARWSVWTPPGGINTNPPRPPCPRRLPPYHPAAPVRTPHASLPGSPRLAESLEASLAGARSPRVLPAVASASRRCSLALAAPRRATRRARRPLPPGRGLR